MDKNISGFDNLSLNKRAKIMWEIIWDLQDKLKDLSENTEEKDPSNYTKSGGIKNDSEKRPVDLSTGLPSVLAGSVIWNDTELLKPAYGKKPSAPIKGYNRHSHSRFSGGALDINTLELVEYDIDWALNNLYNKDIQSVWRGLPTIKQLQNSKNENVSKIGYLDLIFNADTHKWGTSAYEIDVKKCYLVLRDEEGNIEKDINGQEMKAPLYNEDVTKTNLVWDKNSRSWRFYATYAEDPEIEE